MYSNIILITFKFIYIYIQVRIPITFLFFEKIDFFNPKNLIGVAICLFTRGEFTFLCTQQSLKKKKTGQFGGKII